MKKTTKQITIIEKETKRTCIDMAFPVILYKKRLASEYLLFKNEWDCTAISIFDDPVRVLIEHRSDKTIGEYIGEGFNWKDKLGNKARLEGDLEGLTEAVMLLSNNVEKI